MNVSQKNSSLSCNQKIWMRGPLLLNNVTWAVVDSCNSATGPIAALYTNEPTVFPCSMQFPPVSRTRSCSQASWEAWTLVSTVWTVAVNDGLEMR